MKTPRKLKRYIAWNIGIASFIMIAAYSILMEFSLFKGMEETATFDLKLISRDFAEAYEKNDQAPLPQFPRLAAYIGEKDLPAWLKKKYSPADLETETAIYDEPTWAEWEKDHWTFHIVFPTELQNGNRLYLIKTYTEKDDIPEAFIFSENMEILILGTGISFIIMLMAGVRYLFRKVSVSLDDLSLWATTLDRENLEKKRPKFKFREIHMLADLIHNAVTDLHDVLRREHRFLRHASHELRTPIAVLRSNMDLLERIKPDPDEREKLVYDRIRRAGDSMHQLTETLLWLSRKEEKMPAPEPVYIEEMITGLIRENQYLLKGKNVELMLDTRPASLVIPLTACRIAMGNLIRNAFQYTNQGKIQIKVTRTNLTITNLTITNQAEGILATDDENYGFGLGLMLVKQICRKLGLSYKTQEIPGGHQAILSWEDSFISVS